MKKLYKLYKKKVDTYTYIKDADTDIEYVLTPFGVLEELSKYDKDDFFTRKVDAMYANLLVQLENGTPITNYKSSPYYQKYIDRLRNENPEFLI